MKYRIGSPAEQEPQKLVKLNLWQRLNVGFGGNLGRREVRQDATSQGLPKRVILSKGQILTMMR